MGGNIGKTCTRVHLYLGYVQNPYNSNRKINNPILKRFRHFFKDNTDGKKHMTEGSTWRYKT